MMKKMGTCSLLILLPFGQEIVAASSPASPPAQVGGKPQVVRFDANPIIRPEMLPGRDGRSITGPSLIRVPDWLEKPLGKYYLYFAHHHGKYIRLAYADRLEGPWRIHEPATLSLKDVEAVAGPRQPKKGASIPGVSAPDVHVDRERREIRMYVGVSVSNWGKGSAVAISQDGIHFKPRPEPLGAPYFRVFEWRRRYYALDRFGGVSVSRDGLTGFEKIEPAGLSSLASGRKVGRRNKGPLGPMRHAAVLVADNRLSVFFSRAGDTPESIMLCRIELAEDPRNWKISKPIKLLEPETEYEGANLPLVKSRTGPAHRPVRQLRDPAIYQEDGKTYLLYSVAGESGIAIAEYRERGGGEQP